MFSKNILILFSLSHWQILFYICILFSNLYVVCFILTLQKCVRFMLKKEMPCFKIKYLKLSLFLLSHCQIVFILFWHNHYLIYFLFLDLCFKKNASEAKKNLNISKIYILWKHVSLSSICFASQVNKSCLQDNSTGKQDKSNN